MFGAAHRAVRRLALDLPHGPHFSCIGIFPRFITAFCLEHVVLAFIVIVFSTTRGVPKRLQHAVHRKERKFKRMLRDRHLLDLSSGDSPRSGAGGGYLPPLLNPDPRAQRSEDRQRAAPQGDRRGLHRRGHRGSMINNGAMATDDEVVDTYDRTRARRRDDGNEHKRGGRRYNVPQQQQQQQRPAPALSSGGGGGGPGSHGHSNVHQQGGVQQQQQLGSNAAPGSAAAMGGMSLMELSEQQWMMHDED